MGKKYYKPYVKSETHLEQTSLQCNLHTTPPFGLYKCGEVNKDDYSKGGAWNVYEQCASPLFAGNVAGDHCGMGGPDSGWDGVPGESGTYGKGILFS